MRGVGLVLVDERSRRIDGPDVVGRAHDAVVSRCDGGTRQHHEVGVAALDIERIIGLQGNVDGAAAALAHQVKAVIEELAEQGEPGVEWRRQASIGCHVADEIVAVAVCIISGDRREVVVRLVDDQVADGARLGTTSGDQIDRARSPAPAGASRV
jgi:hypothetical protein